MGKLDLDGPTPYITLEATEDKAGCGIYVPLRADLADDLRRWLDDQLEAGRKDNERTSASQAFGERAGV